MRMVTSWLNWLCLGGTRGLNSDYMDREGVWSSSCMVKNLGNDKLRVSSLALRYSFILWIPVVSLKLILMFK